MSVLLMAASRLGLDANLRRQCSTRHMLHTTAHLSAALVLLLCCTAPASATRRLSQASAPTMSPTSSSEGGVITGSGYNTEATYPCPSNRTCAAAIR